MNILNRYLTKRMKNEDARKLSVEEAAGSLYDALSAHTGWKYLKSQRCLKATAGNLVFQLNFYTSKWNRSYESVEMQCECQLWCKKFDKTLNVNSQVGYIPLKPENGEWYDISDEKKLTDVIEQLRMRLDETVIPLYRAFEEDFSSAVILLTDEDIFYKYNIKLRFLDVYAGRDKIVGLAEHYYASLPGAVKQDIEKYRQGDRSKAWMMNPSNLRYIVDNGLC